MTAPQNGQFVRLALATAWLLAAACGSTAPGKTPPGPDPEREDAAAPAVDARLSPDVATTTADTKAPPAAVDGEGSAPPPDAQPTHPPAEAGAPGGVVKMMVMGSSNEIRTCWRAFLWKKLRAAGVTAFDMVGGQTDGPDCGVPGYDKDDESRNGTIVTDISADEFARRFKAHPPDIVLVHFGGADILQGIAPAKVIPGYTLMVEQARLVNPRVRFLVAEHTPMTPSSCAKCPTTVPELNALIVAWAKQIDTPTSPVSSVDLFTGIDPATDTSDRVHLNDAGSQKVSDRWLAALLPILKP